MGCASSAPAEEPVDPVEAAKDQEINRQQANAQANDANIVKLLLLGAGDSGKTTLRKQFRSLYGSGFSYEGRLEFQSVILGVLFEGTAAVLDAMKSQLGISLDTSDAVQASKRLYDAKSRVRFELTEDEANDLKKLFADVGFRAAMRRSAEYQLQDCFATYAEEVKGYPSWGGVGWVPSVSDCIAARVRTSGIQTEEITLEAVTFRIFDVGGQRAERRKWISCFDGVTGVIFVAAASEYDQVLYEDKAKNRLEEAVELFTEMANHNAFKTTPFILFLNKKDLFVHKYEVNKIPLNKSGRFPDAPENASAEEALTWMKKLFVDKNKTERQVFAHVVTAVDPDNVQKVFRACKQIILSASMQAGGFA